MLRILSVGSGRPPAPAAAPLPLRFAAALEPAAFVADLVRGFVAGAGADDVFIVDAFAAGDAIRVAGTFANVLSPVRSIFERSIGACLDEA